MAVAATLFSVLLLSSLLSLSSSSESPQELASFKPSPSSSSSSSRKLDLGAGCSYTVKIKTSCRSPRYTRDIISLAFGDAYHNEVYAPRLDDPASGAFERCSTDTYRMQGPCGYGVCYLYLRREGWDGWVPEWVQVLETSYGRSVNFFYGTPLPNAVWFGFNKCGRYGASAAAGDGEKASAGVDGGAIIADA